METQKGPQDPNNRHDAMAFAAWGGLIGGAIGLVAGLVTSNWFIWAVGIGTVGYIAGALIDSSRR